MSGSPLPDVDTATTAALAVFRQGDHLPDIASLPVTAPDGTSALLSTPAGVVVVSQTCDVVQSSRLTVLLAPLAFLSEPTAGEARDGKRPRYVHLPEIAGNAFADLEVVATVAKASLSGHQRKAGVRRDEDVRSFGLAVGRRFSRFPFPDEVVPWLQPLEDVALSKANKPTSPEGLAFADVAQLRVECENKWDSAPYELVLAVILKPGVLPTFPGDNLPDIPDALAIWLRGDAETSLVRTSAQIADRLTRTTDPTERHFLWMALGEAWADRCRPRQTAPAEVQAAVTSIRGEVVPADEYDLARVQRSETLDLDHLSLPTPR